LGKKNVNKKKAIILISLLLVSTVLSGCIGEEKTESTNKIYLNKPPEAIITTNGTINSPPDYINLTMIDAVAYEGDIITFDASNSYDPDGEIVSYTWIWEDNTNSEGVKTERKFEIANIFELQEGLPLVFSIILQVKDNNQSEDLLDYWIGVIPRKHVFYFDLNELKLEKPGQGEDSLKITLGKFRPVKELNYDLEESIYIQKCTWNATIYLEKSLFTIINRLSILLYDGEGNQITREDQYLGFINLWREKTIQIKGSFNDKEEFKSVKLVFYGLSLLGKTHILYGGETASQICFDFTT
jgi:hypothetical protein